MVVNPQIGPESRILDDEGNRFRCYALKVKNPGQAQNKNQSRESKHVAQFHRELPHDETLRQILTHVLDCRKENA